MAFTENPNIFARWATYPNQIQKIIRITREVILIASKNKGIITIQYRNGIRREALYREQVIEWDESRTAVRAELYLSVILENNNTDTLILDVSEILHIENITKTEIIHKFKNAFSQTHN
ncbi:hypothetical protein [Leptospira stimsonii]|uniref:WYL domain-containing protein n=1 Tax=Leptospira stimsonii TaxID=2202203 RepID=A0A8B3CKB6_9LEPT|nr:hypothetical protein [Leptospira stimsonii]RHX83858.1 hypothetical protein DLM78_20455 [Leptospira stimsonii]